MKLERERRLTSAHIHFAELRFHLLQFSSRLVQLALQASNLLVQAVDRELNVDLRTSNPHLELLEFLLQNGHLLLNLAAHRRTGHGLFDGLPLLTGSGCLRFVRFGHLTVELITWRD